MSVIKYIFTPNYLKYEGVRPLNIYLLRLLYSLMFVGVALEAWGTIVTHQGPWDHTKAVGLIRPLRWLPIVIFMIFYKTLWVIVVAYPLWRVGALAGSPADEMAHVFVWAPVITLIVPWVYVFKHYVLWSKPQVTQ